MKTVTLDVRSLGDTLQDFIQAWDTGEVSGPRISFETPALLFKVLTGKRWELLKAMTGMWISCCGRHSEVTRLNSTLGASELR